MRRINVTARAKILTLLTQGVSIDAIGRVNARKWRVMAKRHYQPRSPETDAQARFVRNWAAQTVCRQRMVGPRSS
jgi:hypothetical protein